MQKIIPFLWFKNQAEEAVDYYTSVFREAEKGNITRMGPDGPVIAVNFKLFGQEFVALNGNRDLTFNESTSFLIQCYSQEEVDHYWNTLSGAGEESMCGWLKDKFGVSWQVIPVQLQELMTKGTPEQSQRVMNAMLQMRKIVIADIEAAYEG